MQNFEKFNFFWIQQEEITPIMNNERSSKVIVHSYHLVQVVGAYFPLDLFYKHYLIVM